MSSMDNLISEYFAQDNGTSNLEKAAQFELFAKMAANNGIDLEKLSEEQIAYLWNETFKTAEPFEGKETPKEEKEEEEAKKKDEEKKAAAEFEEKRAAAAKLAEADYLGRFMAHALTDEIRKIASGETKEAGAGEKLREGAKAVVDAVKKAPSRLAGSKGEIRELSNKAKDMESIAGGRSPAGRRKFMAAAQKAHDAAESERKAVRNTRLAVGGSAVGLAGGAAAAGHKKESSALDELAGESAILKAGAAGFDAFEAASRIEAVLTLGVDESTKVASASDLPEAIEIRSLELLEAAGYPVTWNA